MRFLGQEVPLELARRSIEDFWRWAVENWEVERVPRAPKVAGVVVETPGNN
jgi:hypothetical protein